jgi:hypothetical protein
MMMLFWGLAWFADNLQVSLYFQNLEGEQKAKENDDDVLGDLPVQKRREINKASKQATKWCCSNCTFLHKELSVLNLISDLGFKVS